MIYRLVNIEWKDSPKKLYRKLYVQDGLTLDEFGCILLTSLNATFEHEFLFEKDKIAYFPKSFDLENDNEVFMGKYEYSKLAGNSVLIYDTGANWEFNVTVSKETKELECDAIVLFVDGKGLGIWEDNPDGLWEYVNGKTKPSTKRKDLDDKRFPWNLNIETLSDWDDADPVLNKYLDEFANQNIKEYKSINK